MFENQLTSPPPVYAPKVVTCQGKVIRHEYTVAMASFTEQILPPSMKLNTPVWGYGGTANDALTGVSLGFVQSSPGPIFEATRGIPLQVEWQNNISSAYMFAVDPTIHWLTPTIIRQTHLHFQRTRQATQMLRLLCLWSLIFMEDKTNHSTTEDQTNGSPQPESMAHSTSHINKLIQTKPSTTILTHNNQQPFGTTIML